MSDEIKNIHIWLSAINNNLDKIEKTQKTYIDAWDLRTKVQQDMEQQIEELEERDLQLRKIMRFWIARYPLKEKTIMDLLDSNEGIKFCQFELPKGSGGEKTVGSLGSFNSQIGKLTDSKPPEPREDDVINIRDMVKTLTNKEWILVKREDLQFLFDLIARINGEDLKFKEMIKYIELKEAYSL